MDHGFITCHASIISINLGISKLLTLHHYAAADFQLTKLRILSAMKARVSYTGL